MKLLFCLICVVSFLALASHVLGQSFPFKEAKELVPPGTDVQAVTCGSIPARTTTFIAHGTRWFAFYLPGRFAIYPIGSRVMWIGHYGRDGELEVEGLVETGSDVCKILLKGGEAMT
jgi:hypothetical protein